MMMLILSIVALGVGPALFAIANRFPRRGVRVALEILIIVAVGGITLIQILPEILESVGWLATIPLAIGLLGPTVFERWMKSLANPAHLAVRHLVVVGLALHEFLDGLALRVPSLPGAIAPEALSLAIVIHRLTLGLVVWWLTRPRFGVLGAALALGFMAAATVLGYCAGGVLTGGLDARELALFEALVAGSLLHVVVHQHEGHRDDHDHQHPEAPV
jgi:uncharacterized protein